MNLKAAIAQAKWELSPGPNRKPHCGLYQVKNGQYLFGPLDSLPYKVAKRKWTWQQFLAEFEEE